MKDKKTPLGGNVSWKETTPGGIIYDAGNATRYKTGEWRSMKPVWNKDKCKQCMLCFPVCPDSSILVEDGKMTGIDYDHCKGCGVCVEACPFNVFDFVKEE
ncbi:4Fe-4S binding protein [Thermohalobacter berrensis]|uniref:Ferredoxin n=1 Tax=Thermohalobacter berrensis TaxID=99594 RepID=A0A419SU61_9FIRM|nr:4Fe-4S binding protein [Thermohalobacter berrensis]RKD28813.1 ferredoxin [Thermohalobacter berrensis]